MASSPAAVERERRSRAARAAGVGAARRLGLTVTDPTVLADLFSVVVHLRPSPVVARVATWTADVRPIDASIARDLAVGSWLHARGVPVAPPSEELPPGPHVEDGFGLSFWTYVEPDPDAEAVSATTQAAMLRELHSEMAGFPGDLPGLELIAGDIRTGLEALGRHGDVLDAVATATLTLAAHELLPLTGEPGVPVLPLHGDAHPNNLVVGRGGPVWIDFEEACRGPAAWDLAFLHWGDPDAVRTGYGEVDPEAMRTFARLRAVHLACFLLAFRHAFGDTESWDDSIRMFVALL